MTFLFHVVPSLYQLLVTMLMQTSLLILGVLAANRVAGTPTRLLHLRNLRITLFIIPALPLITKLLTPALQRWVFTASPGGVSLDHGVGGLSLTSLQPFMESMRMNISASTIPLWMTMIVGVWCVGAIVHLVALVLQSWVWERKIRRGRVVVAGWLRAMLDRQQFRVGYKRRVRLVVSEEVDVAVAAGIIRPAILLPKLWVSKLEPDEIRTTLLHEVIHHKRGDLWLYTYASLVQALLWFQPLLFVLIKSIRETSEYACDQRLLRHCSEPEKYAGLLVRLAEWNLERRRIGMFGARLLDGRMVFRKRIEAVLASKENGNRLKLRGTSALLFMTLVCLFAVSLGVPSAINAEEPITAMLDSGDEFQIAEFSGCLPVKGGKITARMGPMVDPFTKEVRFHQGMDIAAREGERILASERGTVIEVDQNEGAGLYVILQHDKGFTTFYSHMSAAKVKVGDQVEKGALLGGVGSTGKSTGPHVHFEVRLNDSPVVAIPAMAEATTTKEGTRITMK